ncbi:hypothetical protein FQA47_025326 [Oryzias melastigma]|uniref:Uncharacterized protein n=1 Tax=Oryzias melastigma TaxID=30732 RepID=A0A834FSK1_ORYME|nr:hypothetical protein FQA47_025326 [Oryzias melastigma]
MPPNIPEDGARPREESEGLKARRTEASVLVRGANETLGRSAVGIEPFQLRLPRSERWTSLRSVSVVTEVHRELEGLHGEHLLAAGSHRQKSVYKFVDNSSVTDLGEQLYVPHDEEGVVLLWTDRGRPRLLLCLERKTS